jgi:RNA polymerase sigma-70 factor (ECF subfamily)
MLDVKKLSDEELVKQIQSSDQELYAIIIERYQNKLLRYANSLIKDENKAVDAVQESFIKAFINLKSFDGGKKFSSWIYRIVHNEILNMVKKYQKEILLPENFDQASEEDIQKEFEQKETSEVVEKCLREMPIIYSEPLALYYIDEKSYEEISDILRLPMGTVATRISRAKKLMKNLCQKK